MRRIVSLCFALLLVMGVTGVGFAADWTLEVGGSHLKRSVAEDQTLFRSTWDFGGEEVLNAEDLDFGFQTGLRFSLACDWGCSWSVETAYAKNDWEAKDALTGNVFLVTDVNGASFTTVDPSLRYTSDYDSTEVNLRRSLGERLGVLVGARRLTLTELYAVDSIGGNVPVPVTLDTKTENALTGLQAGVAGRLLQAGNLSVEGAVKFGVFSNEASIRSEQVDTGFGDDVVSAAAKGTSYAGEASLSCRYPLTENLSLRAGYECLLLKDVALATDQLDDTEFDLAGSGVADVDREGRLFAQGVNVALVLNF